MIIESTQNESVKRARALHTKKERDLRRLHFIEGERMLCEVLQADSAIIETAFIEDGHPDITARLIDRGAKINLVTRAVMESLCDTQNPQWVCACVKTPDMEPPELFPNGLIIALDTVQDPGNLGTIIRTADAMGAVGILMGEGCADAFSPKALRATMGSVYHLPIWKASLLNELSKLKYQGFDLICAHLKGREKFPHIGSGAVLIIGNEGNGVSDEIASICSLYRLPMYGKAESLNASVAAGILIYEISRYMKK